MRLLFIDGQKVEIDEKTAIGIDLASYDLKKPAVRRIKLSNSFTIPRTNENLEILGYLGGPQNTLKKVYGTYSCDYYVNNTQFINEAKVQIQEIEERIKILIFEQSTIWEQLKQMTWYEFISEYLEFLSIPKYNTEFVGSWSAFLTPYYAEGGSNGLFLPVINTNEMDVARPLVASPNTTLALSGYSTFVIGNESGGHFCTYINSIFEFIESYFGVNFGANESFPGNVFQDDVIQDMTILFRDIYPSKNVNGFFFTVLSDLISPKANLNSFEAEETRDKTLYDLVIAFIQQFNIIVDQNADSNIIKLRRFDDIETLAPVIDFSGNLNGTPSFKPFLKGYEKNNRITFKKVEEGLDPNTNSKVITCLNESLKEETTLFSIDAYIPQYVQGFLVNDAAYSAKTKQSFTAFKFFVTGPATFENVDLVMFNIDLRETPTIEETATAIVGEMFIASLYSLDSEYLLLNEVLTYPIYYEVKKWLNANDVLNLEFFAQYYIRELNGSFFINKIKGFNPDKSKQATTIELLKISDDTPRLPLTPEEIWVDGIADDWTDGTGEVFTTN